MEKMGRKSQPRVPFGHPGLEIRHPLRGLGVQVMDSKSVLPIAVQNRLQLWDALLIGSRNDGTMDSRLMIAGMTLNCLLSPFPQEADSANASFLFLLLMRI
jgi:hypothetical protein